MPYKFLRGTTLNGVTTFVRVKQKYKARRLLGLSSDASSPYDQDHTAKGNFDTLSKSWYSSRVKKK